MDIFHIHLFLKLYCLFEKTENKRKRGRGWPIKKTFTVVIVRHTRGFIRLATTSSVNASFYFSCASFSYWRRIYRSSSSSTEKRNTRPAFPLPPSPSSSAPPLPSPVSTPPPSPSLSLSRRLVHCPPLSPGIKCLSLNKCLFCGQRPKNLVIITWAVLVLDTSLVYFWVHFWGHFWFESGRRSRTCPSLVG